MIQEQTGAKSRAAGAGGGNYRHSQSDDWRIELPAFLRAAQAPYRFRDLNEVMIQAIDFGSEGAAAGCGGPFGALVVESRTLERFSAGVNLVLISSLSVMHAEIVALSLAQRRLGGWDLSAVDLTLVTSCEPCLMCLGAILWSGVRRLVCGAEGQDAEAAGFDEGPKPAAWQSEFERRGIAVLTGVERARARDALVAYAAAGGVIYNPGF